MNLTENARMCTFINILDRQSPAAARTGHFNAKNTRHSTKAVTGSRTADTNVPAVFIYQIGNIPFPLQMNRQTIDTAI